MHGGKKIPRRLRLLNDVESSRLLVHLDPFQEAHRHADDLIIDHKLLIGHGKHGFEHPGGMVNVV
jgi:hypothetical protein